MLYLAEIMKKLIIISFVLLFISCAAKRELTKPGFKTIYITDDKQITLLLPNQSNLESDYIQNIHGQFKDKEYNMQSFLSFNNKKIDMTALSPMGTTVFELIYSGDTLNWSSKLPMLSKKLNMAYFLADIQMSYYPNEIIKNLIENSDLKYQNTITKQGWTREIFDKDKLIIKITLNNDVREFHNLLRNYKYTISETLNTTENNNE